MYLEDAIIKVKNHTWSGNMWTSGGCGILADAIKMIFPSAEYFALINAHDNLTAHIVVKIGNYFYDANGKSSREELLSYWRTHDYWRRNKITPDLKLLKLSGADWPEDVERDRQQSRYIASLIKRWYPIL